MFVRDGYSRNEPLDGCQELEYATVVARGRSPEQVLAPLLRQSGFAVERPDRGADDPPSTFAGGAGRSMSPTHTRRGRLSRYYICLGASRRGHDTCPVRSIAASEAEGLVLGQVRRLLASPELIGRSVTAVRRENGAAEGTEFEEGEVIEAMGALEPVWDELYPGEQARILRLLIERIDVAPDGISITLHAAGIRSLVAELANQEAAAPDPYHEPMLKAAEYPC